MAVTYPVVSQLNNNVQQYKVVVSLAANATTTLPAMPTSGRFVCTKVVIHDPSIACPAATVSVGSTATSATALAPAVTLAAFTAPGAFYLQVEPGIVTAAIGTTPGVAQAVSPTDTLTITTAGTTYAGTVQVDVVGYTE
jgi:hypothetical protein